MLNAKELKEYRLLKGLSQRDVAMYCNLSHRLIGQVENGERNITENNYAEIVHGINAAVQAKARGTFEEDKKKFNKEEYEAKYERDKQKRAEEKAKPSVKKRRTKKQPEEAVE